MRSFWAVIHKIETLLQTPAWLFTGILLKSSKMKKVLLLTQSFHKTFPHLREERPTTSDICLYATVRDYLSSLETQKHKYVAKTVIFNVVDVVSLNVCMKSKNDPQLPSSLSFHKSSFCKRKVAKNRMVSFNLVNTGVSLHEHASNFHGLLLQNCSWNVCLSSAAPLAILKTWKRILRY